MMQRKRISRRTPSSGLVAFAAVLAICEPYLVQMDSNRPFLNREYSNRLLFRRNTQSGGAVRLVEDNVLGFDKDISKNGQSAI
jgi:hypothetical protein